MSLTGTVGVEQPSVTQGSNSAQLPCPDDGANSTNSNGGCLAITGGVSMRTFTSVYSSSVSNSARGSSRCCSPV